MERKEEESRDEEDEEEEEGKGSEDRKIFVGGLCWETREPQLKEYFSKYGEVESVNLKLNALTGKSRCFAFVVFKDSDPVDEVLGSGCQHAIDSKKVDVKRAKAKPGKVFFGGLNPNLSEEILKDFFSGFGRILEFEIPVDRVKNERKSFGFVTFEKEETMKELIKKGKVMIGDSQIDLRRATPKVNRNRHDYFYYISPSFYREYYSDYHYYSPPNPGGGKIRNKRAPSPSNPY